MQRQGFVCYWEDFRGGGSRLSFRVRRLGANGSGKDMSTQNI